MPLGCRIVKAIMCEMEEEYLHALLMLSVLPGSFTLEAAEEALGLSSECLCLCSSQS